MLKLRGDFQPRNFRYRLLGGESFFQQKLVGSDAAVLQRVRLRGGGQIDAVMTQLIRPRHHQKTAAIPLDREGSNLLLGQHLDEIMDITGAEGHRNNRGVLTST